MPATTRTTASVDRASRAMIVTPEIKDLLAPMCALALPIGATVEYVMSITRGRVLTKAVMHVTSLGDTEAEELDVGIFLDYVEAHPAILKAGDRVPPAQPVCCRAAHGGVCCMSEP